MTILKQTEGYDPYIVGGIMMPESDGKEADAVLGFIKIAEDHGPLPGQFIPKQWDNNLIQSYSMPIILPDGYDNPLNLWGYDTWVLFEGNIHEEKTEPIFFGTAVICNDFLVFAKNSKTGELLPIHCKDCAKSFIVGLAANQDYWSKEFARTKKN